MASPSNLELDAAKFLHKLIQESTDEPTKLATKLYVILQHMRSSGKENSIPYQVISRAMETVVQQNGLDIETLMSSRLPLAAGTQIGDSMTPQLAAGSSQSSEVAKDPKVGFPGNDMCKPETHASSDAFGCPSSSGNPIFHGTSPSINSGFLKAHGVGHGALNSYPVASYSGSSSPMPFVNSSYDSRAYPAQIRTDRNAESFMGTSSADFSAGKSTSVKVSDHEVGNHSTATANIDQGGLQDNILDTNMLTSATPINSGKLPVSEGSKSGMPFKEQHLKQLRAQCLVFLAFRNGLMPKKLHLEIALGNFIPREDGPLRDLADQKGKEQSIKDLGNFPGVAGALGKPDNATDRHLPGTSTGILTNTNLPGEVVKADVTGNRNGQAAIPAGHIEDTIHLSEVTRKQESGGSIQGKSQFMGSASRGSLPSSNTIAGCQNGSVVSTPASVIAHESGSQLHDGIPSQAQSPPYKYIQVNSHIERNLPNFQLRGQYKPIQTMVDPNFSVTPVKDHEIMVKTMSQELTDQDGQNPSGSIDKPPSPKYTTVEKWISDIQKRKLVTEQKRALKQQKTEQKISVCFDKLKEHVNSSEDISAKTKSVIELKKLQLLELQRRMRRDVLNDFFRPIAAEMDRLKSIKKHRIGRRSKQLERYEIKMKEERQRRIRERQKEFFSDVETHRERLEDVFKMKRERLKGFNRYAKEFHKRKERIHKEKIDRIQREKINLLKINDVEGYLRMVQDAKSDRVNKLLKETEKYLQKLGSRLKEAKPRQFGNGIIDERTTGLEENEVAFESEDETDQAKHYLESNEKYYTMAHSIKENISEQPSCLVRGKLREYQMNGLRWLVSLYNNHLNGILADEMGLGKTVQVISLICYLMETKNDRGPFLVVVPSSVLPGWESEINFWAPGIHKIVYSGPPEERRRLFKERIVHQKFNVLLTTYEYLMNKHDRPKLSKLHWHYIIIDEGHRIKNASCKLNADLKLYHSNHRLLLTGTPLQNNLEELWALLNFLLPNIFNSSEDFSQWFNKPFEGNGDNSPDEALLSEEENLLIINRLHQVLRPFVLRRLKHKVENQLPEKIERLVRCEASAYQKLLMKRVEENLGAIGTSKARSVHNSVMELRNICNHPYLSQLHVEEVHDLIPKHYLPNIVRLCGKLEMLDRLLPKLKATDHRVLLFSTMTRLLDVMEDYLCWKQYKYLRLDGHTSGCDRGPLIDQFNKPGSPYFIFLLSIRAGGVGVNLQAADTVIIFDTDWNPQVDLQAQARAHRIGQKKDVLVLRLETVRTVEEHVRAAAEHKLGVANQSITAGFFDNNTSAEDRREYLESLLRESKKEEAAPVLDDDALNDLIARSESEIDVFESVDRNRREAELAAWKQLCDRNETQHTEPEPPLPARLVTDDDLKPFFEAMKISEVTNPGVVSSAGVKRKSGYLGGLDTEQYGRGKRAREVRSYEEKWSEEEFEKICLVASPGSSSPQEESVEMKVPTAATSSGAINGESQSPVLPQQLQQSVVQSLAQPANELTPPSKRGRGRPRKIVKPPEISSMSVSCSALSTNGKIDAVPAVENASIESVIVSPDSTISSTPVPAAVSISGSAALASITGATHQVDVSAACSSQSSLHPAGPVSYSTPLPSISGRGRGRGRKPQTGEGRRGRGRRQSVPLQAISVTPAPFTMITPGVDSQQGSFPSSEISIHPLSGTSSAKLATQEPSPISPSPVASSLVMERANEKQSSVPPSPVGSSLVPGQLNMGSDGGLNSLSPAIAGSESIAGPPTFVCIEQPAPAVGIASSQPAARSSSVIPGSQTTLSDSTKQVKRRGRKPKTEGETSQRGRKRQELDTSIVPGLANQDPNAVESNKSRVSVGRKYPSRTKHKTEAQAEMHNFQSVPSQSTSSETSSKALEGMPVGQVHDGMRNKEVAGPGDVMRPDYSKSFANSTVGEVHTVTENISSVIKVAPDEIPMAENTKDISRRSERHDISALRESNSIKMTKDVNLHLESDSDVSAPGSIVPSGDLNVAEIHDRKNDTATGGLRNVIESDETQSQINSSVRDDHKDVEHIAAVMQEAASKASLSENNNNSSLRSQHQDILVTESSSIVVENDESIHTGCNDSSLGQGPMAQLPVEKVEQSDDEKHGSEVREQGYFIMSDDSKSSNAVGEVHNAALVHSVTIMEEPPSETPLSEITKDRSLSIEHPDIPASRESSSIEASIGVSLQSHNGISAIVPSSDLKAGGIHDVKHSNVVSDQGITDQLDEAQSCINLVVVQVQHGPTSVEEAASIDDPNDARRESKSIEQSGENDVQKLADLTQSDSSQSKAVMSSQQVHVDGENVTNVVTEIKHESLSVQATNLMSENGNALVAVSSFESPADENNGTNKKDGTSEGNSMKEAAEAEALQVTDITQTNKSEEFHTIVSSAVEKIHNVVVEQVATSMKEVPFEPHISEDVKDSSLITEQNEIPVLPASSSVQVRQDETLDMETDGALSAPGSTVSVDHLKDEKLSKDGGDSETDKVTDSEKVYPTQSFDEASIVRVSEADPEMASNIIEEVKDESCSIQTKSDGSPRDEGGVASIIVSNSESKFTDMADESCENITETGKRASQLDKTGEHEGQKVTDVQNVSDVNQSDLAYVEANNREHSKADQENAADLMEKAKHEICSIQTTDDPSKD